MRKREGVRVLVHRLRHTLLEIQGRYRGDTGEIQGTYGGDTVEIWARYGRDKREKLREIVLHRLRHTLLAWARGRIRFGLRARVRG